MNPNCYAVIGGDFRSAMVARQLADSGFLVYVYGFDDDTLLHHPNLQRTNTLKEALTSAFYVILPLPVCTLSQSKINTPLFSKEVSTQDFLDSLPPECFVLGGKLPQTLSHKLIEKGIPFADYFAREEFAVANAVPTAEGAIEIALRETAHTICSSRCLICGYGRIAKFLEKDLLALGANVFVSARRPDCLVWAQSMGSQAFPLTKLEAEISSFDIIFNTIPSPVFNESVLQKMKPGALLIDLASKPGGVDFEAAKRLGTNVIWALSLPGKCAPQTAACIIVNTINNIIAETEVRE